MLRLIESILVNDVETIKNTKSNAKRRSNKNSETVSKVFHACPRCSFFLSAYRLLHSDFDSAVQKSHGNRLDLTWNVETRNLVQNCYGWRIDQDTYHYESICQECRRKFVFKAPATRRKYETFRIEINPS